MNIRVFSALFILLCVSAGYPEAVPSGSSSVLYEDEFGFTGDLNGRMPVTTTGSNAWTSANFEANGSSVAATVPFRTAYLSFTPREGFIYTLSASLSIGTNASSWVSLGFNSPSPNTNLEFSGDGGIGTVILRNSGEVHWFPGPGAHGLSSIPVAVPGFSPGAFYEMKLVLNTTGKDWTMCLYRDGVQIDLAPGDPNSMTYIWPVNPAVGAVRLSANNASANARFDHFKLEQEQGSHNWRFDKNDAANPLQLVQNGEALNLLDGMGPVFVLSGTNTVGPADYDVSITSIDASETGCSYSCVASVDGKSFDYTIELKVLDEKSVELKVQGSTNAAAFQVGTITGTDKVFKQFNTGERDLEAHQGSANYPAVIYWPSANKYIFGELDPDYSSSAFPRHRMPSRRAFLISNPPVSIDPQYGLLTDGSRAPLRERFVIRVSDTIWDVYGPVMQQKSGYTEFLKNAVFMDSWFDKFCYGKSALEFIKEAVPADIKVLTIIQHWAAWNGWDATIPDSWQAPERATPGSIGGVSYGSLDELRAYIELAKGMGMAGVRNNYLHVGYKSWSYPLNVFKTAVRSDQTSMINLQTIGPLLVRQETEIKETFGTTAALYDEWAALGQGFVAVNYDAAAENPGTVSGTREILRELTATCRNIIQGPLLSESMASEFLFGQYIDAGDFCIFNANQRDDFSPEYKLRRLHPLAMAYGMGLGCRHYYAGNWETNKALGEAKYFNSDTELDSYRTCTVLYGNGAYLFGKPSLRKTHVLTEFMTVGLAQRYYAFEPVESVLYSSGGSFKTLEQIIPVVQSAAELHTWFQRVHVTYTNGTHVWVNRGQDSFDVITPENETVTLGHNCWIAYSMDGNLLAYTAVVAGSSNRVDYAHDRKLGVGYANPRHIQSFKGVSMPTVWINGNIHYVLEDPETTIEEMPRLQNDLTQDATVRSIGTYTYFVRGDANEQAVTPFTKAFYPGGGAGGTNWLLHANNAFGLNGRDGTLTDTGTNAAPVPFQTGELTDGSLSTYVAGYIDTLSSGVVETSIVEGYFNVLFDLGAVYNVDQVNLIYTDQTGGVRWGTGATEKPYTAGAQQAWYAESLAGSIPVSADFYLLGTNNFVFGAVNGTASFSKGSSVRARYILLNLCAKLNRAPSSSAGGIGGMMNEVQIMGAKPGGGFVFQITGK